MKKKTLYIIIAILILLNIGKSYSQKFTTTSIEKFVLAQLKDNKIKSKISDKIVVEDFKKLLIKPNKTLTERIFVTKVIDELFPNFVRDENNKIISLLESETDNKLRKNLLGSLNDFSKSDEIVASEFKRTLGVDIKPEGIRMLRNKLKPSKIEVPVIKKRQTNTTR